MEKWKNKQTVNIKLICSSNVFSKKNRSIFRVLTNLYARRTLSFAVLGLIMPTMAKPAGSEWYSVPGRCTAHIPLKISLYIFNIALNSPLFSLQMQSHSHIESQQCAVIHASAWRYYWAGGETLPARNTRYICVNVNFASKLSLADLLKFLE